MAFADKYMSKIMYNQYKESARAIFKNYAPIRYRNIRRIFNVRAYSYKLSTSPKLSVSLFMGNLKSINPYEYKRTKAIKINVRSNHVHVLLKILL